jgi:hypothetical protein
MRSHLIVAATLLSATSGPALGGGDVLINEIRMDQWMGNCIEYFELMGTPGAPLDGLCYIVLGDSNAGHSGVIEEIVQLSGHVMGPDGMFLVGEGGGGPMGGPMNADMTMDLNFEDDDNVTHMLVMGFTGSMGQDLDPDDDGVLDVMPWQSVICSIGIRKVHDPDGVTEEHCYGEGEVGPYLGHEPMHAYWCDGSGIWKVGGFMSGAGCMTPGEDNPCVPGDTDFDGFCDVDDLMHVITDWGACPGPPDFSGADLDQNGFCDVDDLMLVILNWS